jgi:phosphoribosylformylglycinamidine synthase
MRWAVVAPEDSAFEADLLSVLRSVMQHRAEPARAAADVDVADCVVLAGDAPWRESFVAGASREESLPHAVVKRARRGALTLGIGEGFAALCALDLLPGEIVSNEPEAFVCAMTTMRVENAANPWAQRATVGDVWRMPLRTAAGRYRAEEGVLERLDRDGQVFLRFVSSPGEARANRVGSDRDIAGILNPGRNVLGLAVHPEHAADSTLLHVQWSGAPSGQRLFQSIAGWVEEILHQAPVDSQR